jgi:hypothetical protein
MGQLDGDYDPQTSEWVEGVLAKMAQISAKDESRD